MTSFLYFEDDALSREVVRIALEVVMRHENVWIFEDSSVFADKLNSLPQAPDVILLDIHMTPFDGFEMLSLLRQDSRYANSRIIALTASVMSEEVAMLKASGFDGGIGKPIDAEIFPGLIERIVAGETIWHISS